MENLDLKELVLLAEKNKTKLTGKETKELYDLLDVKNSFNNVESIYISIPGRIENGVDVYLN